MQLRAFERAGVLEVHEEQMSAVKSRPVLNQLLAGLKRGDTLVVYKLDRLARSMTQFVRVFEISGSRHRVQVVDRIGETNSPHGRMFLHMLGAFAEVRKTDSGALSGWSEAARAAGKTWGRKRVLSDGDMHWAASASVDLVGMSSRF